MNSGIYLTSHPEYNTLDIKVQISVESTPDTSNHVTGPKHFCGWSPRNLKMSMCKGQILNSNLKYRTVIYLHCAM